VINLRDVAVIGVDVAVIGVIRQRFRRDHSSRCPVIGVDVIAIGVPASACHPRGAAPARLLITAKPSPKHADHDLKVMIGAGVGG
jgi:hypothetical protein